MTILTEEQVMLRDTVRGFIAENAPVSHLRGLRDSNDPIGFSRDLWRSFGEMGLAGVAIPERNGGLGLGLLEATFVAEEIGRNLTPSPFLSSAIGAAGIFSRANDAIADHWLPRISSGHAIVALAIDESAHHRPLHTALSATRRGNGYVLSGRKAFVHLGNSADLLLVLARTAGRPGESEGLTLFAVDPGLAGLALETNRLIDSSLASHLVFDGVEIGGDAVIGTVDDAWNLLDPALDSLRTGLAAELVGLADGAAQMTLDYLGQRKQFGVLIGTFQALQHRAAHLYCELQVARAATCKAAIALDSGQPDAKLRVLAAKAVAGTTALLAVQEGVQMHGGVGMTDEYDIGFYMKRHKVADAFAGTIEFCLDALATTTGY